MAINYLPAEEPTPARSFSPSMRPDGQGVPIPGDLRDRAFCQRLVAEAM